MLNATLAVSGEGRHDFIVTIRFKLEDLEAINTCLLAVGCECRVLGFPNNAFPGFCDEVSTDRRDPNIDRMSIATHILLLVLNVQRDVFGLDDNGGRVSNLSKEIVVLLALVKPLGTL